MIGIYKITSPSKRIYVGQSIDIERRKISYEQVKCKEQPILFNSLKKYGWLKHKFEVLTECDVSELNDLERYYQDLFNCVNSKAGMNCMLTTSNTRSGELNDETKIKISIANTGKVRSPEYIAFHVARMQGNKMSVGRIHPPEVRAKISLSRIGTTPWNKGIPRTDADKLTMSKNRKGVFAGENHTNSNIILNLETGIYYFGSREASESCHISPGYVKSMLNGNVKNLSNFIKT